MDRTSGASGEPFEYRDLVIPVGLRLEGSRGPTHQELAALHGNEGVITQQLDLAAREGWGAAEAADWDSLVRARRFETQIECGWDGEIVIIYKAVAIRLKRLVRPDEPGATERSS